MTEHLDNLLPLHHFLDITIHFSKITLLLYEISPASAGGLFRGKKHNCHHRQRDDRQGNTEHHHTDKYADNRERAVQKLRHALGDHLAQCINIIRVHTHDIPVRMLVKIFNRQCLHVDEHLISHVHKRSLRHIDHQTVLHKNCNHTQQIEAAHTHNRVQKSAEIRMFRQ